MKFFIIEKERTTRYIRGVRNAKEGAQPEVSDIQGFQGNSPDVSCFIRIYAIVVAGGKGRRFGGMKQFYNFQGMPLLIHTLKIFERNKNVASIIVVVPKDMIERTEKLVKSFRLKKVCKIIPGGKRRQDSTFNGVNAIPEKKSTLVIIHDAVRPFVSQNLINRGIRYCKRYKAVIFGLPIYDTVKYVVGRMVKETLKRNKLYAIQTPEFFYYDYLMDAYKKVDFRKDFTDEAAILESAGLSVFLFKGERENIKITTKEDLKFLSK